MAVRKAMTSYEDNDGNVQFRELTSTENDDLLDFIAKTWGEDPSIYLTKADTGNNLNAKIDEWYSAGAFTTNADDYALEEDTIVTQSFQSEYTYYYEQELTASDTDPVPDTNNLRYPLYWDDDNLAFRSMTRTDFYDTFIFPAINKITNSTTIYPGTFIVSDQSSISGYTKMASDYSSGHHFTDKYATVPGLWSASNIGYNNANDYTTDLFYLHSRNSSGSIASISTNAFTTHGDLLYNANIGGGEYGIRGYDKSTSGTIFQNAMRWATCGLVDASYKITYQVLAEVNITLSDYNLKGGSMTDTYYPEMTFGRRYVDADDYRTQNWPSGTPETMTWYLGIKRT
jgi:hypothetical protein